MTEGLFRRLTRHQIQIQRFGGGQLKEVAPVLRDLAKEIRDRIASEDMTAFQRRRIDAVQADIENLIADARGQMQRKLELRDFADQEIRFVREALSAAVTVDLAEGVSLDQAMEVVNTTPMQLTSGNTVRELTLDEAFEEFAGGAQRDVMRQIQMGVAQGETVDDMARKVQSLVQTRSRDKAEAVVRTAVNHTGSMARARQYRANADILDGERWVSTLDSRTTILCQSRDGEVYEVGQGPQAPAHYRCRSLRVPEVKPRYRSGAKGERASMDGPVSNQTTYSGFLRQQGADFQDDVLGPVRGKLFREGEIDLKGFVDDQGRTLSLSELARRNDIDLSEYR